MGSLFFPLNMIYLFVFISDSKQDKNSWRQGKCRIFLGQFGIVLKLKFLEFVGILTKCVGKISWPNVVCKFGVFYHKKRNAEFYQYPVPQKSNFYRQWRLLKKLYKICTNDYENNEYLAVKYITFFNVMFINEQKQWYENEAIIPT